MLEFHGPALGGKSRIQLSVAVMTHGTLLWGVWGYYSQPQTPSRQLTLDSHLLAQTWAERASLTKSPADPGRKCRTSSHAQPPPADHFCASASIRKMGVTVVSASRDVMSSGDVMSSLLLSAHR